MTVLTRLFDRWKQWPLWGRVLSAILVLSVIIGPFVSTEEEGSPDRPSTESTAQEPRESSESPAVTSTVPNDQGSTAVTASSSVTEGQVEANASETMPSTVPLPSYTILEEEDISFGTTVRISLRIVVGEGTSKAQLGALGDALAEQYRESHEYHAFNIFFYHFPQLSQDYASLGSWDDSPYGDWSRANEVDRGDYSSHRPNDETREKDWSLLPTGRQVDLYVSFQETYTAMDTDPMELPSDDDVLAAVAQKEGVTAAEVEEAADAVFAWQFN